MKIKSFLFISVLITATTLWARPSWCRYANNSTERMICMDQDLISLDYELGRLYKMTKNSLRGYAKRRLIADEKNWIYSRNECGRNYRCIYNHYIYRIDELRKILNSIGY